MNVPTKIKLGSDEYAAQLQKKFDEAKDRIELFRDKLLLTHPVQKRIK